LIIEVQSTGRALSVSIEPLIQKEAQKPPEIGGATTAFKVNGG